MGHYFQPKVIQLLQIEIQLDERTLCSHPIKPYRTLVAIITKKPQMMTLTTRKGSVKTYDLEMKNPLKRPPIGVKKKSLEVIPH